ncbi:hypothetical protein D9M68_923990 [compost metagenome]
MAFGASHVAAPGLDIAQAVEWFGGMGLEFGRLLVKLLGAFELALVDGCLGLLEGGPEA